MIEKMGDVVATEVEKSGIISNTLTGLQKNWKNVLLLVFFGIVLLGAGIFIGYVASEPSAPDDVQKLIDENKVNSKPTITWDMIDGSGYYESDGTFIPLE